MKIFLCIVGVVLWAAWRILRGFRAAALAEAELERLEFTGEQLRDGGIGQGWSEPALDDELRRAEGIRRSRLREASIRRGRAAQAARRAR